MQVVGLGLGQRVGDRGEVIESALRNLRLLRGLQKDGQRHTGIGGAENQRWTALLIAGEAEAFQKPALAQGSDCPSALTSIRPARQFWDARAQIVSGE